MSDPFAPPGFRGSTRPAPATPPAPRDAPEATPGDPDVRAPVPGPSAAGVPGRGAMPLPGLPYGFRPVPGRLPPGVPPPPPHRLWPHAVVDPVPARRVRHVSAISVLACVLLLIVGLGAIGTPRVLVASLPELSGPAGPGSRDGHDPRGAEPPTVDEPPPATGSVAQTVRARATAILDAHDRAVDTGDQAPALARLDPAAPGLRAAWQRLTANLRKIPFDVTRWQASGVAAVNPVTAGTRWPLTAKVRVRFEHKIAVYDHSAVVERYVWTLRCADPEDACLVTAIDGAPNSLREGTAGYPAPWDLWDLAVERRPNVLLLGPASGASVLRRWADDAERAAAFGLGAWRGTPAAPGFVLTLTRNREDFGKLYTGEASEAWTAGFSIGLRAADPAGHLGSARIVIDVDAVTVGTPYAGTLLRHEMAHSLLEPLAREGYEQASMWVIEGFAEWFAQSDTAAGRIGEAPFVRDLVRRGGFSGKLPADLDFRTKNEDRVTEAYALAHVAFRYLAETEGARAACAFVENVYGGPDLGDVQAALATATGQDVAEFERAWATWVRRTYG